MDSAPLCPYCATHLVISVSTTVDLPPDEWRCPDCEKYWVEGVLGLTERRA